MDGAPYEGRAGKPRIRCRLRHDSRKRAFSRLWHREAVLKCFQTAAFSPEVSRGIIGILVLVPLKHLGFTVWTIISLSRSKAPPVAFPYFQVWYPYPAVLCA